MPLRVGSTILVLFVTAPALYEPVSSRPTVMTANLPKEAAYFRELQRISRNGLSHQLRADVFAKHGFVKTLSSSDSFAADYGTRFDLVFKGNGREPITGCKMFRSDKRDRHVTINFQRPEEPVTIRTWWVGRVMLYFTFGEKDSTKAVYILDLEVTPRNKTGLTPSEMVAKP